MSSPTTTVSPRALRRRLGGVMLRDERRLARRLDRARRLDDPAARAARLEEVAAEVAAAEERLARRRAAVPTVTYPPELPISGAIDELRETLASSQVVVVAGDTGSGKTTQLPKACLELGRGVRGAIGHTQPRRLAARTVAHRIADELEVAHGQQVGHKVRFSDQTSESTLIKLMTDGIALAETAGDPLLRAYDTLIVDEAHERSLNIDFLLGYLHRLLPRRPELSVIITSATIDTARFAEHFDAPVVEVSGRTYPVEVRYRPLDAPPEGDDAAAADDADHDADADDAEPRDQAEGIVDAVNELVADVPGDILVFVPGERDIREAADALADHGPPGVEVLPLHARLPATQQQRIFQPHKRRRVVLATNVAETSLTVPGVRAVVDTGTARISRYSQRTKVQRLPIEPISQASAAQRAGRCGREGPGVCIRLYRADDLESRPEHTDPEIQRTNLASVILQMISLGLGEVRDFPFLEPPDERSVRAGEQLLHELTAVERDAQGALALTSVGKTMARLPVDPRLARMLIAAQDAGCLHEALIVVAALSVQDPRERPLEQRDRADALHARFADERSDLLGFLHLWDHLAQERRELTNRKLRRACRDQFLNHGRVREWWDLHGQLREVARELRWDPDRPASVDPRDDPDALHHALLSGLLSQIGVRPTEGRDYLGPRGTRFALWPGSALADGPPPTVMAAELVETSRLWARGVAPIHPEWAEERGAHLVRRTHDEPRWDRDRGAAVTRQRVTLYGVPLVADRTVPYWRVDPAGARQLLISEGLVAGEAETTLPFAAANRETLARASELARRARRPELAVDAAALEAFYDQRLPGDVTSIAGLESWWREADEAQRQRLHATTADLLGGQAPDVRPGDFPDAWPHGDLSLALSYRFAPGEDDDGVTVEVPLSVLGRVRPVGFDWHVPGLRAELVAALLRSLPKDWRRRVSPLADTAAAVHRRLRPAAEPLVDAVAREVAAVTGVRVPREALDLTRLPDHLRLRFAVTDGDRVVAAGRDLAALQRELAGDVQGALTQAGVGLTRHGATQWVFGTLPREVRGQHHGAPVTGYPALVDEGETVGVRVLASPDEQRRHHWVGTRRLLRLTVPLPARALQSELDREARLILSRGPHGSVAALLEDAAGCALDALLAAHGGPAWDEDGFARLRRAVAGDLFPVLREVLGHAREALEAAQEAQRRLADLTRPAVAPSRDDAGAHLDRLVHPRFLTATGRARLPDVVRYLRALVARLDKLPADPARDQERAARVAALEREHRQLLARLGAAAGPQAREIGWMIEELRVSLFAQHLGTRQRVSEERVMRAIVAAER